MIKSRETIRLENVNWRIYILPPSESQVRPSMDEEDGIYNLSLRFSKDVAVCDAIELGGLELDPRISWGDFVNHCEGLIKLGMEIER